MSKIDNFKDGIFNSDFPEMMKKEFSRDVYQGLSKEEKEEKFSQWFIDNLVHMFTDAFVKEIQFGDVNEKWLEKYKTKELLDILEKRIDDDSFGSDKGQMESILNTISLLFKREREFQFVKGKEAKTPEEIDALLFPSKKIKTGFLKSDSTFESSLLLSKSAAQGPEFCRISLKSALSKLRVL